MTPFLQYCFLFNFLNQTTDSEIVFGWFTMTMTAPC